MAKIVLENTRPHLISLHVAGEDKQIQTVSVPGARPNADQVMVNGSAVVDGDLVEIAREQSAVVEHYFREGWLREIKGGGPASKKSDKAA